MAMVLSYFNHLFNPIYNIRNLNYGLMEVKDEKDIFGYGWDYWNTIFSWM